MSERPPIGRRALDLFEDILDWPETGSALEARVAAACAGEPELLVAVRRLIAQDQQATRAIPTTPPEPNRKRTITPPERIARWRLCEVLGVGGMGAVYRAERADGVFEQTVAIKLLRPGLLSASAEARFGDERRMLARLRHPNIAQLYDGGTDAASGHAWLAMEYVVGSHITVYAAQHRLSLQQRLDLFSATCDAVQHAHQNLIVHADLKPSNILVTTTGEVKLVDFGIAQWLAADHEASSSPIATTDTPGNLEPALTPAYAAPERLCGGSPTPAGDVYSLGVLLAELLSLEPAVRVDADLYAILNTARAADPARRYRTVAALGEDIERYGGHFPLLARPPDWRYISERFIRRHPTGVALGTLAAITLIGATAVMSTLYVRAEHARAQADQRFQEVRQLANFMIFDLYDEFAKVPGTTAGRRTLVSTAQRYLNRLSAEHSAPLELRLETQVGLARLATVAGVPGDTNLGDVAAARRTLDQVIAELDAMHAQAPARADIRTELAFALVQRAAIDIWSDQQAEAARPRLARARSLLPPQDRSPHVLQVRQAIYHREADVADWAQDPAALGKIAQQGLDELAKWPADMRNSDSYVRYATRMRAKLADSLYYSKDIAGALDWYRKADAMLREALVRSPDSPDLLALGQLVNWSIASTLSGLGRNDEAVVEFDRSLKLLERARVLDRNDIALLYRWFVVRSAQADALSLVGRHEEAIAREKGVLRDSQARMAAAPSDPAAERAVAYGTYMLATLFERAGRAAEACRSYADAVERFRTLESKGHLPEWDRTEHLETARRRLNACAPQL